MKYLVQSAFTFLLLLLTMGLCDDAVRLTDIEQEGDNVKGDVEIYYNAMWRPLCARIWSISDANVVCKTIGFHKGAVESKTNDLRGQSKRRNFYYIFYGLGCTGTEFSIEKCRYWNTNVFDLKTCSDGIAVAVCKR